MSTEKKPPRFKKGKGRPTKISPEIQKKIVEAITRGNYTETAAALAGISKDTFYAWLKKGARQKKGPFKEFSDAVDRAQAEAEAMDLVRIEVAANGRPTKLLRDEKGNIIFDEKGKPIIMERSVYPDWTAAAWRLERRFPERWSSKARIEHTGKDGGPITFAAFIAELEKDEDDK
jgi:transposase